jgi:hypothetical protein
VRLRVLSEAFAGTSARKNDNVVPVNIKQAVAAQARKVLNVRRVDKPDDGIAFLLNQ